MNCVFRWGTKCKIMGVGGGEGVGWWGETLLHCWLGESFLRGVLVWDRNLKLAALEYVWFCCFLCCSSQLFLVRPRGRNSCGVLLLCQLKETNKKKLFLSNLRIGFPPPLQRSCLELLECLTSEKSKYFISGFFLNIKKPVCIENFK